MVDEKDEQIEEVIEEPKSVEKKAKVDEKKDTSIYVVDLLEGDRIVGQVSFDSAKDSLEFTAPDREGAYNLGLFVKTDITTVEEKVFNPVKSPKDWLLNLHNVAPLALYKSWSASEAREII